MSLKIYHNPRCSKSRTTLNLIQDAGKDVEIIEYLKAPPTAEELKDILNKLDLSPEQILRKKEAKEEGIADLTGDVLIDALAAHPRAIERPIVVAEDRAVLGRPPENVQELL